MKTKDASSCIEIFITKENSLQNLAEAGNITEAIITGMRCPKCQEKVGCSYLKTDDQVHPEVCYQSIHLCLNPKCDWLQEQATHVSKDKPNQMVTCPFCDRKLS